MGDLHAKEKMSGALETGLDVISEKILTLKLKNTRKTIATIDRDLSPIVLVCCCLSLNEGGQLNILRR